MSLLRDFYRELSDRNVIRVGGLYIAIAWMIIESGDILLPLFSVPDSAFRWIVITLFVGFPIALGLAWVFEITSRGVELDEDARASDQPQNTKGRGLDFGVIGVLIVALIFSLYLNFNGQKPQSRPAFEIAPIRVLIADFINDTGEPLFSGTVEQALEIGLEEASFINAFPRHQALEVAQQINPLLGILDTEHARLVAMREDIKLVLSGDAAADGKGYVISVTAINPTDGATVIEISHTAADKLAVLEAVAKTARDVRRALGEVDISNEDALETFTAASLKAVSEYVVAQRHASNQAFEEAIVHYQAAVNEDQTFGRAWSGWALAAFELGQHERASQLWGEALKYLGKMSERERLRTTGVYYTLSSNDYSKAIETYRELVDKYPADDVATNNLAVVAFLNGDLETAITYGTQASRFFPNSRLYQSNLALYKMYASDFAEAASLAEQLIANHPSYEIGYLPIAFAAIATNNFDQAEQVYQRMRAAGSRGASIAELGIADMLILQGDFRAAIKRLPTAIADDIDSQNQHGAAAKQLLLAHAHLLQGEADKMSQAIKDALALNDSHRHVVQASQLYIRAQQFDKAIALAEKLKSNLSPQNRAYRYGIAASISIHQNDSTSALDALRSGSELSDLWWLRYLKGRAYLLAERYPEALSEFQVCIERLGEASAMFLDDWPTWSMSEDTHYWLAKSQQIMGMQQDAVQNYRFYLVQRHLYTGPQVEDSRNQLANLESTKL